MEKMSAAGFSFETARRTMARHGINEIPYKLGNAVANWVRADPARVAEIEAALVEGEDLEKQALCAVLQDLGEAAAPLLDRLLEVARSDELDPESRSCAISTLGALGVVNSLVSEAIEQALRSPHWFIRGNAAGVAGSLVLDPPHFIPLVMCLLEDDEGHDWSPSEKAVEALGKYGPAAVDAIGAIEALRAATESDDTWLLDEIERALALIRGDEPPPREDD
jgi:hypothetical protein